MNHLGLARNPALAVALGLALATSACTTLPPAPATAQPTALPDGVTPAQMVATIRAAAIGLASELDVQPLRDPQVEDLRQDARAQEARGQYQAAADTLQQALAITPEDPALMQEAAEVAVLLWQLDRAEQLARRGHELGGRLGPLCRRHWSTVEQVTNARLANALVATAGGSRAAADAQAAATQLAEQARRDAAAARLARDACTVAAPNRF